MQVAATQYVLIVPETEPLSSLWLNNLRHNYLCRDLVN